MDDAEKKLGDNLEKAAIYLKGKVKEKLNITGQPYLASEGPGGRHYANENPSQPGEAPHKMLGNLQRSMAHAMGEDRKAAYVGTNLDYGLFLEIGTVKMAARPYLRPTFKEEADALLKIVATGGK